MLSVAHLHVRPSDRVLAKGNRMLKEFKEFAMKGNVVDMAVGIVIGGAFGKIVTTFVSGIVMPLVGLATGGIDFSAAYFNLTDKEFPSLAAAQEAGAAVVTYGAFIQVVIDFIIIAFVIFLIVRAMNNAKKEEEDAPPPANEVLLGEIRDLLKK